MFKMGKSIRPFCTCGNYSVDIHERVMAKLNYTNKLASLLYNITNGLVSN